MELNRLDRILLIALTLGIWGVLAHLLMTRTAQTLADPGNQESGAFGELTVERLNIVDARGKTRIVLSSADRFPNPVVRGKEYPRSIKPAGIVFYREDGDEAGGVALLDRGADHHSFAVFDYSNSEGIGWGVQDRGDKGFHAGISIQDRLPLDADIEKVGSVGPERLSISNNNGTPEIRLNDPAGQSRLRLWVDKEGSAKLEITDQDGRVLFQAPDSSAGKSK